MAIQANPPLYQLSFLELTSRSYEEASSQFAKVIGQEPICLKDLPSLAGRAMHLALSALLILPIINTVVLIAMEKLGGYIAVPPLNLQVRGELVQILDRWVAASPNRQEQRAEAKRRVLVCYDNRKFVLNLTSLKLSSLPVGIFVALGNLGCLDLSHNQLSTLPAGIFAGLGNLRCLDLSHNQLSTLPAGIFAGLGNLDRLRLYYNQLSILPAGIFAGLGNLRKLHLNRNQLSTLPAGIFAGLGNLRELSLSDNALRALPAGIFVGLGNLDRLRLFSNQLSTLTAGIFAGLGNLRELTLADNRLMALPAGVFAGLGNLRQLGLGHNQLSLLHDSFYDLPNGCEVDLRCNRFTANTVEQIQLRAGDQLTLHMSIYEPLQPNISQGRTFVDYVAQLREDAGIASNRDYIFEEDNKSYFESFMSRVHNSLVYRGQAKPETAQLLLDCLDLASVNTDFRDVFFNVLNEASTSCGDRVALGINSAYIQYCLYTEFPDNLTVQEFVVGLKRLELLEARARAFVAQLQGGIDEIEVYLALQVHLQARLRLPVYSRDMLYFNCSRLTPNQISQISDEVVLATEDQERILLEHETWRGYLFKKYASDYEDLCAQYTLRDSDAFEKTGQYTAYIQQVQDQRETAVYNWVAEKTRQELER